jgi:hypothetical protein
MMKPHTCHSFQLIDKASKTLATGAGTRQQRFVTALPKNYQKQ